MESNAKIITLPLTDIRPPDRRWGRPIDRMRVEHIAESIADIGLRQPITVRPRMSDDVDDGQHPYVIVTGQHRYLAVKKLAQDAVVCIVMETDALRTELWTLDENLLRSEPSTSERIRGFKRRQEIYEALHPATKHGRNQYTATDFGKRQDGASASDNQDVRASTFTEDAAERTGRSQRSVQRDITRAKRIDDELLAKLAGTELDNGAYFDRLARLPVDEQCKKVTHDLDPEAQGEYTLPEADNRPKPGSKEPAEPAVTENDDLGCIAVGARPGTTHRTRWDEPGWVDPVRDRTDAEAYYGVGGDTDVRFVWQDIRRQNPDDVPLDVYQARIAFWGIKNQHKIGFMIWAAEILGITLIDNEILREHNARQYSGRSDE